MRSSVKCKSMNLLQHRFHGSKRQNIRSVMLSYLRMRNSTFPILTAGTNVMLANELEPATFIIYKCESKQRGLFLNRLNFS